MAIILAFNSHSLRLHLGNCRVYDCSSTVCSSGVCLCTVCSCSSGSAHSSGCVVNDCYTVVLWQPLAYCYYLPNTLKHQQDKKQYILDYGTI